MGPGKHLRVGDRKLYLQIEGPTERAARQAKADIKAIIEEHTEKALMAGSRYQM